MSMRSIFAAFAALAVIAPAALRAQTEDIDFAKARREFVAGQPRATANTLVESSLGVRQQVGRCRDEVVGQQLLDAESNLEKLATALRAGTVKDVKALDAALTSIDRSLAHHHLLLVKTVLARPRPDNIPTAVSDLDRSAFHYERSIALNGTKLTPEQSSAVADVRKLSKDIETTNAIPNVANLVVTSFEKLMVAATTATASK